MKYSLRNIIWILLLIMGFSCVNQDKEIAQPTELSLMPTPAKTLKRLGSISLNQHFWVIADLSDSSTAHLANYLVASLEEIQGISAQVADLYSTRKHEQSIKLEFNNSLEHSTQGYNLSLTSKEFVIQSNTAIGLFYGSQTFLQILEAKWDITSKSATLKKMVIKDEPLFKERELRIAEELSTEKMVKLLGSMDRLKMNRLSIVENQKLDKTVLELAKKSQIVITSYSSSESQIHEPINLANVLHDEQLINLPIDSSLERVIFLLSLEGKGNFKVKLWIAAQLGWSGSEQKDYKWIIDQHNKANL